MKIRKVDDAINEILRREKWFSRNILGRELQFVTIRIQDIARHMHRFFWKYRDKILKKIQRWAEEHPYHSIWVDEEGIKWKVGYGQQMHPRYGYFCGENDMLELYRVGK